MKKSIIIASSIVILGVFAIIVLPLSCTESTKLDVPKQVSETTYDETTPLGLKLEYMRKTYDAEINYKWDRNVFSPNAVADPASGDDVLPYLDVMELLFFKTMKKVQDPESDFSNKETPVHFFLMGSGINYGGKALFGESTVGQAGNIQPNRLTLGGLTNFGNLIRKGTDQKYLDGILKKDEFGFPYHGGLAGFLYHEFTHYINSKHGIPKEFSKAAFDNYLRGTNAYMKLSEDDARTKGFMLPYGMQNEMEDFATYVQIMIWQPQDTIVKNYLKSEATKAKLKMVHDFYLALGLDLYKVQEYLHSEELKQALLTVKRRYETP